MTSPSVAFVLLLLVSAPQGTPAPLANQLTAMDDATAVKAIKADPEAARKSLDELLKRLDASVHSDRTQPEQRRVEYETETLTSGLKLSEVYAKAISDRSYLRRFRARKQRLDGTQLLNDRSYRKAIVPLTAALRESQVLEDRWLETITRINLAYGYLELGEGKRAIAECTAAHALAIKLDKRAQALTLLNLASAYLHLGRFAESVDYAKQAATMSHEVGIRLWEGNALLNLGGAYQRLGQDAEARTAFEQALAVLEKTSDRLGVGRTLYNLGLVASAQQRYADAATLLERALPIIRGVDIRHSHSIELDPQNYQNPYELSAVRLLASAYMNLRDEKKAAEYMAEVQRLETRAKNAGPAHSHK